MKRYQKMLELSLGKIESFTTDLTVHDKNLLLKYSNCSVLFFLRSGGTHTIPLELMPIDTRLDGPLGFDHTCKINQTVISLYETNEYHWIIDENGNELEVNALILKHILGKYRILNIQL